MKRWPWIAAVVAALGVVAGCGNDEPTTAESPSALELAASEAAAAAERIEARSTPEPPPEPTEDTGAATIAQYASLIAGHEGGWRESVATIEDTCTDPDAIPICAATYVTAMFQAETLSLELSGAGDEIGEPPAEIAGLVADTEAAASAYADAYEAWSATGCDDPLDDGCGVSESFEMTMALDELTEKFDAWRPYT